MVRCQARQGKTGSHEVRRLRAEACRSCSALPARSLQASRSPRAEEQPFPLQPLQEQRVSSLWADSGHRLRLPRTPLVAWRGGRLVSARRLLGRSRGAGGFWAQSPTEGAWAWTGAWRRGSGTQASTPSRTRLFLCSLLERARPGGSCSAPAGHFTQKAVAAGFRPRAQEWAQEQEGNAKGAGRGGEPLASSQPFSGCSLGTPPPSGWPTPLEAAVSPPPPPAGSSPWPAASPGRAEKATSWGLGRATPRQRCWTRRPVVRLEEAAPSGPSETCRPDSCALAPPPPHTPPPQLGGQACWGRSRVCVPCRL